MTAVAKNPTWTFTDFEFNALWYEATGEWMPWPFAFTTDIASYDEFVSRRRRTMPRLIRSLRSSFDQVLRTFSAPEARVVVNGWGGHSHRDPDAVLRLLAVRRGDRGYLVTQAPGRTYWHGEVLTVTECDPLRLADTVVRALPERRPGGGADIVLPDGDIDDDLDYFFSDAAGDRARQFLDAPLVCAGAIHVIQHFSAYGPRGSARYRLNWRDLDGDGRYVIDGRAPTIATAADHHLLVALLDGRIDDAVAASGQRDTRAG
ncbi:ESX secretion-associated protein EspG [Nocardia pseudobrasiliensis]|uniref:ESAT-6 protein secretion system EspG family protein n=1 Tax=Nocardia pseudobrasiliensis TaxID=45979 RepID=A0A370HPD7_9NOCA|nr:ESX secretion-associated protein EspG [Nocardia pseudobrasiliensis]RDI60307.1 ESAT-6 protein secretion system EspG family protein [Nocardia pseudobrasiliensis]